MKTLPLAVLLVALFAAAAMAAAPVEVTTAPVPEANAAALAERLQNPVADLISMQFQNNFNFGVGEKNGTLYLLNIQPDIPLHVTRE